MFKKRYSRPGEAPATLHAAPDASAVVIKLTEYGPDGCEERILGSVADLPDAAPRTMERSAGSNSTALAMSPS